MAKVIIKFEDKSDGGIAIKIYRRYNMPTKYTHRTTAENFSNWCFKHIQEVLNYWTKLQERKDLH